MDKKQEKDIDVSKILMNVFFCIIFICIMLLLCAYLVNNEIISKGLLLIPMIVLFTGVLIFSCRCSMDCQHKKLINGLLCGICVFISCILLSMMIISQPVALNSVLKNFVIIIIASVAGAFMSSGGLAATASKRKKKIKR